MRQRQHHLPEKRVSTCVGEHEIRVIHGARVPIGIAMSGELADLLDGRTQACGKVGIPGIGYQAGAQAEKRDSYLEQIVDFVRVQPDDLRAASRIDLNQPIALEDSQSFPNGRAARPKSRRDLLLGDAVAGLVCSANDRVANGLSDLLG
jgi:hypothetical protein